MASGLVEGPVALPFLALLGGVSGPGLGEPGLEQRVLGVLPRQGGEEAHGFFVEAELPVPQRQLDAGHGVGGLPAEQASQCVGGGDHVAGAPLLAGPGESAGGVAGEPLVGGRVGVAEDAEGAAARAVGEGTDPFVSGGLGPGVIFGDGPGVEGGQGDDGRGLLVDTGVLGVGGAQLVGSVDRLGPVEALEGEPGGGAGPGGLVAQAEVADGLQALVGATGLPMGQELEPVGGRGARELRAGGDRRPELTAAQGAYALPEGCLGAREALVPPQGSRGSSGGASPPPSSRQRASSVIVRSSTSSSRSIARSGRPIRRA